MSDLTPVRPKPADAVEQVAALPRRTAHAAHALLACCADLRGPAKVGEVILYDEEALSTRATAAALGGAKRARLADYWGGVGWVPTTHAHDLREALEDRFLADTKRDGDA